MGRTALHRIPSQIAYGDAALWVASAVGTDGVVQQVDPATGSVAATTRVRVGVDSGDALYAPPTPSALAVGAGRVWTNNLISHISRFGASRPSVVTRALPLGRSADGIALGAGALWIASGSDDRVLRLDPGPDGSWPRSRSPPHRAHLGRSIRDRRCLRRGMGDRRIVEHRVRGSTRAAMPSRQPSTSARGRPG